MVARLVKRRTHVAAAAMVTGHAATATEEYQLQKSISCNAPPPTPIPPHNPNPTPGLHKEGEERDAFEERVKLGSKVRFDLLTEREQKEWRRRRTAVVHRATEMLARAQLLSSKAKEQKEETGKVSLQQASTAKELSMREAELEAAEEMLQVFTQAQLKLLDAGLEDIPRRFADAVVSGALSVESLYALRLSDGSANINRPARNAWRHSDPVKIVCAIAKTRQRCAARSIGPDAVALLS